MAHGSDGARRRVRYQVAASLDGFIAGPDGDVDWIVPEPSFDFTAHFAQFDTFLMGRRTWEALQAMPGGGRDLGRTLVFSRTLRQEDHPDVEIVSADAGARLTALRAEEGKDIWLFGGGQLFHSLLALGQVDTVEIALVPALLGGGVSLLPSPTERKRLKLTRHEAYPSGLLMLEYSLEP